MRFLGYTIGDDSVSFPAPTPETYARMDVFMTEAREAGVLLATGALTPTTDGVTVRLADGAFTVSDGQYAAGKELIGGWALLEAPSTDEAVGWAKRFLAIVGGGESRIRPVY
jgi:hypothetical protein